MRQQKEKVGILLLIFFSIICGCICALQFSGISLSPTFYPIYRTPDPERPTINIPFVMRQSNWGGGSCVHANLVSLLRWQERSGEADYWRKAHSGSEWPEDMATKLDYEGIRYAYVTNGDINFLEWACRTRRGCGITVMGGIHMVTLVHLDKKWAAILDNNNIKKFKWIPRETLVTEWKASNGWAITPVYSPAAPLP